MRFLSAVATLYAVYAAAVMTVGCSHNAPAVPPSGGSSGLGGIVPPMPTGLTRNDAFRKNAVMNHVLTWLIIGDGGTNKVGPLDVVAWVDYTMTKQATSVIAHALGMKTIFYSDPNRVGRGNLMYTHDETTFAHECDGKRITISGTDKDLMDVHSLHLWSLWHDSTTTEMGWGGGGNYDYVFEDTADSMTSLRLSGMPCNFDQNDWTKNNKSMDNHLGYSIIYNGLSHIPRGEQTPAEAFKLNP